MKKKVSIFAALVLFAVVLALSSCCQECSQKIERTVSLKAPEGWGCPLENSMMEITFLSCQKTFKGSISASNLLPNHSYIMCINGNEEHKSSNRILKKHFSTTSTGKEGYYDFYSFVTDSLGSFSGSFDTQLPCSNYNVRLFLKDEKNQHCIVLQNQTDIIFSIGK